jgi:hypothetical protein
MQEEVGGPELVEGVGCRNLCPLGAAVVGGGQGGGSEARSVKSQYEVSSETTGEDSLAADQGGGRYLHWRQPRHGARAMRSRWA